MYFNRKDKNETYFASGSVSSFCSEGHEGDNAHMYFHKSASWHDVPRTFRKMNRSSLRQTKMRLSLLARTIAVFRMM